MATLLSARSRLTVFHLEGLTVAYTTQSSDSRGLGDIAIVTVVAPDSSTGDHLWRLAASMFTNPPPGQTQARWILTQCTRARAVKAPTYRDLPDAYWPHAGVALEIDSRVWPVRVGAGQERAVRQVQVAVPHGVRDACLPKDAAGKGLGDGADSCRQGIDRRRDPGVARAVGGAERRRELVEGAAAALDDLGEERRHRVLARPIRDRVSRGSGQRRAGQALHRQSAAWDLGAMGADVAMAARVARARYEYVHRAQPRQRGRRPHPVQRECRRAREQCGLAGVQERGA
ncbi:hypothetical protein HRW18_05890 [Streptomyces lunaelactis]|uniref:hypothetical protein n=1 Tax=Streptomyces lunaelactis TaxID=1535768 RepID=UPI001585BCA5|nr:hypothetical protein [Streptomyces lunaelactis]NUK07552.1 hypothetical protein [Streptomyces lunaelactis]